MMQTVAWIAAGLVFATFYVRNPVHMRRLAILSNIAFILYAMLGVQEGIFDKVQPILVLHVSALGINWKRLKEASAQRNEKPFPGVLLALAAGVTYLTASVLRRS